MLTLLKFQVTLEYMFMFTAPIAIVNFLQDKIFKSIYSTQKPSINPPIMLKS